MTAQSAAQGVRPRGPLDASLRVPGSRSITNRALAAAALAGGESRLEGALASDDTEAMADCLGALGVEIVHDRGREEIRVRGCGGQLAAPSQTLDVRQSGTTARFITALASLAAGPSRVDGAPRMRERPIQDLVDALRALGAEIEIEGSQGCPPLRLQGGGLAGGTAQIDASRSSQYVSGVLLAAPYAQQDVKLSFKDGVLVSRPYVDLTLAVMRDFGASADWQGRDAVQVRAGQPYQARHYQVEADASSAVYPLAAAAIAGGRVRVEGLSNRSLQADVGFAQVLERMGCQLTTDADAIEVRGAPAGLRGIDIDMNEMPDAAITLAVVALFAEGPSRIRNVANLRIKESDRLAVLESELRKLGAHAQADADSLEIEPGDLHAAEIDPHDDHRMAMAFALAGLKVPGLKILDPGCVAKTWPDYFAALERL